MPDVAGDKLAMLSLAEVKNLWGTPAWAGIPLMYKQDLRGRSYGSLSGQTVLHWLSSGGSTGEPVLYPWTADDETIAEATVQKIHERVEGYAGTALIVAPTGLPAMWYHMNRQLRALGLATAFPGVDSVERIFNLIERLEPSLLISLPLVLSRLGELRAQRTLPKLSGDGLLFCGGDVLSNARRTRIEQFWGAQLRNFYGLSEAFGPLAAESEGSRSLAWRAEQIYVEVVDAVSKQPVAEGETGIAVITTLWQRPASLVRYWTGDCFRLVGWLAPAQPIFEMRGRQGMMLPKLKRDLFPLDVDEAILADPAAGNEWMIYEEENGALVCQIETAMNIDVIDTQTKGRLAGMIDSTLQLVGVPPGTLDRSIPKLAVSIAQQSGEKLSAASL
jgi:phenylacetate-coenzyme A ligase PaaK-like adenylate-forming protein